MNCISDMPTLFVGHGSPMNALERNSYTDAWRKMGEAIASPRAILAISAHWFIGSTILTAMSRPRTIHDFDGFPAELFAVNYPAPGLPELAGEIAELVKPEWVGADIDQWGLDHGTWSVLAHMYPKADIPVVQLSINALKPMEYHLRLGARLAELRKRGVLIVASGNVVHNLRAVDWRNRRGGFDWALRFDEAAKELLTTNPGDVLRLLEHADFDRSVPTPDHFIPLVYTAGLAAEGGSLETFVEGTTLGSISMTSYSTGTERRSDAS
ncbi:4,5-DOPA-extradiol-dioxygenase [Altererythrobacter sp. Z27]|uniref:4,5-DOPA-extradiol-dioxygenase n=1 Tax=Altererythrobacter sp. Z27 TaxID=3461147 RepID=UPI0040440471